MVTTDNGTVAPVTSPYHRGYRNCP